MLYFIISSFPYPHECLVYPTFLSTAVHSYGPCDCVRSAIGEEVKSRWRLCLSVHIQAHVVKQSCESRERTVISILAQGTEMLTAMRHTENTSISLIRLFLNS